MPRIIEDTGPNGPEGNVVVSDLANANADLQQDVAADQPKASIDPRGSLRGPGRPRKRIPSEAVDSTPPQMAKKRNLPANGDVENPSPRKRGRPRKNAHLLSQENPSSSVPGSAKASQKKQQDSRSQRVTRSKTANLPVSDDDKDETGLRGTQQKELEGLLREVFVVNAIEDEKGLRINHQQASQLHSIFAPGLPAPNGEVFVSEELANSIRDLLASEED
ncbi:hypothetical protein GGR54DRAFT_354551 [Hypoxylon sp. NC1633]|nr:hypothetical protein GGR54DRAFT_354551 [Hypoxylon sp. NC1633]